MLRRAFHASAAARRAAPPGGRRPPPRLRRSARREAHAPDVELRASATAAAPDAAAAASSLADAIDAFAVDPGIQQRCEAIGIAEPSASALRMQFVRDVQRDRVAACSIKTLAAHVAKVAPPEVPKVVANAMMPHFMASCANAPTSPRFRSLRAYADLRKPGQFYPSSRALARRIIMHVGPTNSGKTYQALRRLEEEPHGKYCGPLRLLAHEVYERMNARGVPCRLVTGEERRESTIVDAATGVIAVPRVVACTVEMADFGRYYDVAVLDEIQMIADEHRGWAWTEALLAIKARELHLCGEASAVDLVRRICAANNETVEVNEYQRLNPLQLSGESLQGQLKRVQRGDCVVAFSRRDIFALRSEIERETKLKCAIIYGALPPETRAEQAKLFNDRDSGYDVLVASDAVGMGLNLNIQRVVFDSLQKFDGTRMTRVSNALTKQIAGRAGRFGVSAGAPGLVTTLWQSDLQRLKQAMEAPSTRLKRAGLQPSEATLALFTQQFPGEPFSAVLRRFVDLAETDDDYYLCNVEENIAIAELIDGLSMPFARRKIFINAPISLNVPQNVQVAYKFAKDLSMNHICLLERHVQPSFSVPKSPEELSLLEQAHRNVLLYLWLHFHHPACFGQLEAASAMKKRIEKLIDSGLVRLSRERIRQNIARRTRGGGGSGGGVEPLLAPAPSPPPAPTPSPAPPPPPTLPPQPSAAAS